MLITKDKYPIINNMITRSCQDHAYYEYTEIGGRGIEYKHECTQNVNKVKKLKLWGGRWEGTENMNTWNC